MDSIDITDSAFSLEIPGVNKVIDIDGMKDYTIFIYIGATIVIAFITMFIFKFYMNKTNSSNQLDCSGGFCTMGNNPVDSHNTNKQI